MVSSLDVGLVALAIVLAAAIALRVASLQAVPFAVQEAERAFQARAVAEGAVLPGWPGDLAAVLTAHLFRLGLDGEWVARAVSAAAGSALVLLAYWWARPMGRASALLASLLLALSPMAVGASRTAVPGAWGGAMALVASGALLRYGAGGGWAWAGLGGAALGLALAADEVGVVGALALIAFALADLATGRQEAALARLVCERRALAAAASAFVVALALGAVRFGVGPQRLWMPGLRLWGEMLALPGDGLPRPLFLWALVGYEPLLLVAGLAAVGWLALCWLARRDLAPTQRLLLAWALLGALAMALATRRHVGQPLALLIPMALAAGLALAHLSERLPWRSLARTWPLGAVALGLLAGIGIVLQRWGRPGGALGWTEAAGLWLAALALVGAVVVGWALLRERALPPLLVAGAIVWAVVSLHGAFSLGFAGGDEFVLGARPTPTLSPLLAELRGAQGPVGLAEEALWLGWHLRHRPLVIGDPTPGVAVYVGREGAAPPGFVARGPVWVVAAAPALPPMHLGQGWRWFALREVPGQAYEVGLQIYVRP